LNNEWYQKVKCAINAPNGEEMRALLEVVQRTGVYEQRSSPLHRACAVLLEEQTADQPSSINWLLNRLGNAGLPPSHADYLGLEVFPVFDPQMGSAQLGRATFRFVYDLLATLLEAPRLASHPLRERLERCVNRIQEKCRDYVFSKAPVFAIPRYAVEISLLPQSNQPNELIFLRTLQCTDSIFFTASILIEKANELIEYGDVVEAIVALHWLACLLSLLVPLLRPLICMSVESWLVIRLSIAQPSAIQSTYFHKLCAQLNQLRRILDHSHMPEEQLRYITTCTELLDLSHKSILLWYNAHIKIAAKYGQASASYKPKGVAWLEKQNPLYAFGKSSAPIEMMPSP
jgi:hypothetical protein